MMNQIKPMIVVASLLISGIAQAQDWSCDNGDKVQLESYSTYIVINNKYRAHLQGDCNAAQGCGSKGGKVYANNGYTYTLFKDGTKDYLSVKNKWGKDTICR